MALLTPGYWPTTYWPSRYWFDNFWAEYGKQWGSAMVHRTLLYGVTENTTGDVVRLKQDVERPLDVSLRSEGPLILVIHGITNATVKIYGGVDSDRLSLIGGGTFTADAAQELNVVLPHVRADVEDYVSGIITVEVGY